MVREERRLAEPCIFCGRKATRLMRDMDPDNMTQFHVECVACLAQGPSCDCGEESAVPTWLNANGNTP